MRRFGARSEFSFWSSLRRSLFREFSSESSLRCSWRSTSDALDAACCSAVQMPNWSSPDQSSGQLRPSNDLSYFSRQRPFRWSNARIVLDECNFFAVAFLCVLHSHLRHLAFHHLACRPIELHSEPLNWPHTPWPVPFPIRRQRPTSAALLSPAESKQIIIPSEYMQIERWSMVNDQH